MQTEARFHQMRRVSLLNFLKTAIPRVKSLMWLKFLSFAALLQLLTNCSTPIMQLDSDTAGKNDKRVFVVHNNWHAALIVRKADLSQALFPEQDHFPEAEYLEIGWGDRDYFPATEESVGLALRAAFWSSGSVLHVVSFRGPIGDYFVDGEIIELALSPEAFQRLSEFVSASFSRADRSVAAQSQPGLVPHARFYPAAGRFSILRTCNTWIADSLKNAGLDISPRYIITAASLARQVRPHQVKN
jgi:uncharacterized protein (TIGR02117 family)